MTSETVKQAGPLRARKTPPKHLAKRDKGYRSMVKRIRESLTHRQLH